MTIAAPSPLKVFEDLYQDQYPATVNIAYAFTGDLAEAQDIAQEAFCRAWERWHRLIDYDDPGAWVRHVAANLARSRWRKLKTATGYLLRQRVAEVDEVNADRVAVVAALRRLPRNQREAIVWHHLADLPVQQVAEQMQVPVSTVKTWLRRGREVMARELAVNLRVAVTAPELEEVAKRADSRRRGRVTVAAVVALVVVLTAVLGVVQLLRGKRSAPPVRPSPSASQADDPIRALDWSRATMTLTPVCAGGKALTFSPEPNTGFATAQAGQTSVSFRPEEIVYGDVTGDGWEEALIRVACGVVASDLILVTRVGDRLEGLMWLDHGSDAWIDSGVVYQGKGRWVGDVVAMRYQVPMFREVESPRPYPRMTSLDFSPIAHEMRCEGAPGLAGEQIVVPIESGERTQAAARQWNTKKIRDHATFARLDRPSNPYLMLTVECAALEAENWTTHTVLFGHDGQRWRAAAAMVNPGGATLAHAFGDRLIFGSLQQPDATYGWRDGRLTRLS